VWGAAAVLLRILRNKSPQASYAATCGALGIMILFVLGTYIYLTNQTIPNTTQIPAVLIESAAPDYAWLPLVIPCLSVGWMLGVTVLSIRLLGGWHWLFYGIKRGAVPVPSEWQWRMASLVRKFGIARKVRLLVSLKACVPLVAGWIAPVVILPVSALLRLTPEALEAIIAHELAHIRRHDFVVNLMQSIVEVLFFYHPAVWRLSGKIRELREHCCDDAAVKYCGSPISYASALADLETLRAAPALPQLAPAANGASLMKRIQRLLSVSEPATSSIRAGLFAAVLLSIVGASALWSLSGNTQQKLERQRIIIKDGNYSVNVQMRGDVKLDTNFKDGADLGDGAALEITAKENDSTRRYALRREGNDVKRTYRVNGQEKPLDAEAEAWIKDQVQEIKSVEVRKSRFSTKDGDKISFEITEDGKTGKDSKVIVYSNRGPMVLVGPGFDGMTFNFAAFDKLENEESRKRLEEFRKRFDSEEFRKEMLELNEKYLASVEKRIENAAKFSKEELQKFQTDAKKMGKPLKGMKIPLLPVLPGILPELETDRIFLVTPDSVFLTRRSGSPEEQKKRIEGEIERLKTRMGKLQEELNEIEEK
jgi:beta-lactamase regulating signal transducer with metallopeptidase domain